MAAYGFYEIGKEFYLLRSGEPEFHRNIYFKRFVGPDGRTVNMIMDPGTKLDLNEIVKVSKQLFGGIANIDIIFVSHQDPDLTSNLDAIMSAAPRSLLLASMDTWRLVRMYGLPERRFKAIEDFRTDTLRIKKTGHTVKFIPAHYCHFRGAMMFYDFESRVLFTGDFLGGTNTRTGEGIFATEESWDGIALFHQIYMPTKSVVRETIDRIGLLDPFPEVIAPQHGDVIKGKLIFEFLNRLMDLDVGIDLLEKAKPEKEVVILAINDFLEKLKAFSTSIYQLILNDMRKPGQFTTTFVVSGDMVTDLKIDINDALRLIWNLIERYTSANPTDAGRVKGLLIQVLNEYKIKLPFRLKPEESKPFKEILSDM